MPPVTTVGLGTLPQSTSQPTPPCRDLLGPEWVAKSAWVLPTSTTIHLSPAPLWEGGAQLLLLVWWLLSPTPNTLLKSQCPPISPQLCPPELCPPLLSPTTSSASPQTTTLWSQTPSISQTPCRHTGRGRVSIADSAWALMMQRTHKVSVTTEIATSSGKQTPSCELVFTELGPNKQLTLICPLGSSDVVGAVCFTVHRLFT